tara:strand:- start:58 stop:1482 length:1425 start_codon:yes stop_codon:yes gene_type:complete
MSKKVLKTTELLNLFNTIKNKKLALEALSKKEITYGDFYKKALSFYSYLKYKKKLKSGDKIFIELDNSIEFILSVFSCLLGGFIACPIDNKLPKERYEEIHKILKPKFKIKKLTDIKFFNKDVKVEFKKDKPFLILFTSGTTGEPKGILLNRESYIGAAFSYGKMCNYNKESNIYLCLPIFYNAGLLNVFFSGICSGSSIIIGPRISALNIFNFWEIPLKYNINTTHLTPEIINALCKITTSVESKDEIKKIQIISTANYLYNETKELFERIYGIRVLNCFGITEAGGPLTLQAWEHTYHDHSVGIHAPEIKFKILLEDKVKKILVKTPYLMNCYILPNGKFFKPKLINGYYNTGDVGKYSKGHLFIEGRRADIIKKGGEIISLNYLDKICNNITEVEDSTHLSTNDIEKGSKIFLFIKFKNIKDLERDVEIIFTKLRKKLKSIEIAEKIIPVPSIPRLFNGKLNKKILRKLYL